MGLESFAKESKFLGATFILVSVIGFAAWLSLTNPLENSNTSGASAGSRVPASVNNQIALDQPALELPQPKNEINVLEIHCRKPPKKLTLAGGKLRIRLVGCKSFASSQFTIKNEANGFTASVFKTNKDVTTDYIDLVPGLNHLKVEIREEKAALREIELEVDRQKDSEKKETPQSASL